MRIDGSAWSRDSVSWIDEMALEKSKFALQVGTCTLFPRFKSLDKRAAVNRKGGLSGVEDGR